MQNGNIPVPGDSPSFRAPDELLALCAGLLPVWARHLATSRAQSEAAVAEMLKAFSDIGPHIHMAERQSQQINDALAHPIGGGGGLVEACEQVLEPLLQDASLAERNRQTIESVLTMVRNAVGALEQLARPFQQQTQMVAEQVDRMYMGFQYQDRVSQMMTLLEGDIADLQAALSGTTGPPPNLADWLVKLESRYAMAEQHDDHRGAPTAGAQPSQDNETTFF